jgi:tRNA threonylcarbamoyladenosine biosynthesis protein TsaE
MQARVNNMIKSKGVFITNIFGETQRLGEEFAKDIVKRHPPGVVLIALHGELGSGKTTFVQGMAKGLGITRRIISPTFVVVRGHRIRNKESRIKNFYHIDLYRIENEKDIKGLGLEEIINNPQNIVAIEWAEKMEGLLSSKRWGVRFEYLSENKRRIVIARVI